MYPAALSTMGSKEAFAAMYTDVGCQEFAAFDRKMSNKHIEISLEELS